MKTIPSPSSSRRSHAARGFALVEVLCSAAIAIVALTAALISFTAVHRAFIAALHQMDAQSDQSRVQAYIRRDLRSATGVEITDQGTKVTITLPDQDTPALNLNLGLTLLSLLTPAQQAPKTTTIRYYRQGTSIIREVNGATTALSSSATQFGIGLQGSLAKVNLSFQPRFCLSLKSLAEAATTSSTYVQLISATYTTAPSLL